MVIVDKTKFDSTGLLQRIARTINISEVTFLFLYNENIFIRWFSSVLEVDLYGHTSILACALSNEKFPGQFSSFKLLKSKEYELFVGEKEEKFYLKLSILELDTIINLKKN